MGWKMSKLEGFSRAQVRSPKGFYYRRVFRTNELMDCSVLKNLELTTREMLRRRARRAKVTRYDVEQQGATGRRQRDDAEQLVAIFGLRRVWTTTSGWGMNVLRRRKLTAA